MNIGEGYRWNIPRVYYGYDQSFLDAFGTVGVEALETAIATLNEIPPSSTMVVTNFPAETGGNNAVAAADNLIDMKSRIYFHLLQEMGLASPWRYAYTLRYNAGATDGTNYTVEMRNFDPITLDPTNSVNGAAFTYVIVNQSGLVEAVSEPVDPSYDGLGPVVTPGGLMPGENFNGLTRDDAGAIRYLLSPTNLAFESLLPGVAGATGSNFVGNAIRPGVGKITFIQAPSDPTTGQFISFLDEYSDSYLTGGVLTNQALARTVSGPDILFTAQYLGPFIDGASLSGTSNWVNNGPPGADGPGIIQPPVVIALNSFGVIHGDDGHNYPDPNLVSWPQWGSFAESTKLPVALPSHPTSGGPTTFHLLFQGSTQTEFSWVLPGASNAVSLLQTSVDLSTWVTMAAITNLGGNFTFIDQVLPDDPHRFFKTTPSGP